MLFNYMKYIAYSTLLQYYINVKKNTVKTSDFIIYKNKPIEKNEISNFISDISPIRPIMIKILSDVSNFVEVDIFNK